MARIFSAVERLLDACLPTSEAIKRRILRGTFWSFIGAVFTRILNVATSIAMARLLGRTLFGELGMVNSTIAMATSFATFGFGLTATRYIAERLTVSRPLAGDIACRLYAVSILFAALIAVLLSFASTWMASTVMAAPHLAGILRVSILALFFIALNNIQQGILSGFEAFKSLATVNGWGAAVSMAAMGAGAYWGQLEGVIWGNVVGTGITALLAHRAIHHEARRNDVPLTLHRAGKMGRVVWSYSFPTAVTGIIIVGTFWLGNAILANQPHGYGEMGLLNAAMQWRNAILFLPYIVTQPYLPILSNLGGAADQRHFRNVLGIDLAAAIASSLLPALLVMIAAGWIISAYGADFSAGRRVVIYVAAATALAGPCIALGQAVNARMNQWYNVFVIGGWALAFLLYVGSLRTISAESVAIGHALAYAVQLLLYGAVIWRLLRRSRVTTLSPLKTNMI